MKKEKVYKYFIWVVIIVAGIVIGAATSGC
jgi:hypothetical protein